jgi:hypothetical protein
MILIFLLNFFLVRYITYNQILPVVITTVRSSFSAMKIVNNRLRSRMSDQWMNDNLYVYIGKDIYRSINNKVIM